MCVNFAFHRNITSIWIFLRLFVIFRIEAHYTWIILNYRAEGADMVRGRWKMREGEVRCGRRERGEKFRAPLQEGRQGGQEGERPAPCPCPQSSPVWLFNNRVKLCQLILDIFVPFPANPRIFHLPELRRYWDILNKRALQLIRELSNSNKERSNWIEELSNWIRERSDSIPELSNTTRELSNSIRELSLCVQLAHLLIAALCNWIWELTN